MKTQTHISSVGRMVCVAGFTGCAACCLVGKAAAAAADGSETKRDEME